MSKRNREFLLVTAALIIGVAVWWVHIYSPRVEELAGFDNAIELAEMDIISHKKSVKRLKKEIEALKEAAGKDKKEETREAGEEKPLARLLMEGKTIEEINAGTQLYLQGFMTEHGIDFKSYKELPPSKWSDYRMGRLQFQINTSVQGFSDLLEYFDNLEKAIRIERLTINYRRGKEAGLTMNLQLGTLFVGELEK